MSDPSDGSTLCPQVCESGRPRFVCECVKLEHFAQALTREPLQLREPGRVHERGFLLLFYYSQA